MAAVAGMAAACARPTTSSLLAPATAKSKTVSSSAASGRVSLSSFRRPSPPAIINRSCTSLGFSGSSTLCPTRLPRLGFSAAFSAKIVRTPERCSKLGGPSRHGYGSSVVVTAAGYKLKTHKASAKRFRVTGTGRIVRRRAGKQHLLMKKTTKRRKRLSKMVFVKKCDTENIVGALPYLKVAKRTRIK